MIPNKYIPYSYSKQESFYTCPSKFKFEYIDKIKTFVSNSALEKGSYLHHKIEEFLETPVDKKPFTFTIATEEEQKEFDDIVSNIINSNYYIDIKNKLSLVDTYGIEEGFSFDLNWLPLPYKNKDVIIRGYIDLYMIKGSNAIVIDHKSGKYKDPKWQTYDQVMLYALWIMKKYPQVNTVKSTYSYIEHNTRNTKIFTRVEMEYIEKYFTDKLNTIENENNFPKKVTKLCLWCDYYKQSYCKLTEKELLKIL